MEEEARSQLEQGQQCVSSTFTIINCSRIPEMLTVPFAVVTDPEDPKFDLEKLVAKWEKESK